MIFKQVFLPNLVSSIAKCRNSLFKKKNCIKHRHVLCVALGIRYYRTEPNRRSSASVSSVQFRTELTEQLQLPKNQRLRRARRTLGGDATPREVRRCRGRQDSGSPGGGSSVPRLVRLTEGRNRINRTNFGS